MVISIIGMLASVVLASLSSARAKAKIGAAKTFATYTYHALGIFTDKSGVQGGGLWTFDDSNGTVDSSGGNNSLTYVGTIAGMHDSTNTFNNAGHSLKLNGSSEYVFVNNAPTLNLQSGTVGAWINVPTNNNDTYESGWQMIAANLDSGGTAGFWFALRLNQLGYYSFDGAQNFFGPLLNDGQWHYVAFSFNNSAVNGSRLYIDGSAVGDPFKYVTGTPLNTTFFIGGWPTKNQYFKGNIDDLAYYPQALSAGQIHEIYAMGLAKHGLARAK